MKEEIKQLLRNSVRGKRSNDPSQSKFAAAFTGNENDFSFCCYSFIITITTDLIFCRLFRLQNLSVVKGREPILLKSSMNFQAEDATFFLSRVNHEALYDLLACGVLSRCHQSFKKFSAKGQNWFKNPHLKSVFLGYQSYSQLDKH